MVPVVFEDRARPTITRTPECFAAGSETLPPRTNGADGPLSRAESRPVHATTATVKKRRFIGMLRARTRRDRLPLPSGCPEKGCRLPGIAAAWALLACSR